MRRQPLSSDSWVRKTAASSCMARCILSRSTRGRAAAVGVAQPVEAVHDLFGRGLVDAGDRRLRGRPPGRRGSPRRGRRRRGRSASWSRAGWRRAPRRSRLRRPPSGRASPRRGFRPSGSAPRPSSWSGCRPYCSAPSAAPGSARASPRRRRRSWPIPRCRAAAHAAPPDRDGRDAGRCGPCSCRRRGLRGSRSSCSATPRRATRDPWPTARSAP